MKPDTLYVTEPCGSDTNPQESGKYLTNEGVLWFSIHDGWGHTHIHDW